MPIYRPSTVLDLDMVLASRVTEPISWVAPDLYQQELAGGSYRPEWTWLAQGNGELVGHVVWWAPAGRKFPVAMDCLWVADDVADRTAVATALLQAGYAGLQRVHLHRRSYGAVRHGMTRDGHGPADRSVNGQPSVPGPAAVDGPGARQVEGVKRAY